MPFLSTSMNTVNERHIILVCLFCVQNYGEEIADRGIMDGEVLLQIFSQELPDLEAYDEIFWFSRYGG